MYYPRTNPGDGCDCSGEEMSGGRDESAMFELGREEDESSMGDCDGAGL